MNLIGRTLHILSLAVLLFAGLAHAQNLGNPVVQVNVPFEFNANNKVFPAGHYSIVRVNPSTLVFRDSRDRVLAAMIVSPAWSSTTPNGPKLVFYTYGGKHILARVWMRSEHSGYEVSRPKAAVAVAKETVVPIQTATGSQP
jgi:hypothetical protein